jgi:Outer membrane protein beta-barrel domain
MHLTKWNSLVAALVRTAAVTLFSTAATLCLHAQALAPQPGKAVNLKSQLMAPVDLTKPDDLSYSSSVGVEETASAENFAFRTGADQPPPHRTYSRRTNYSDKTHNADGSNKYTFAAGGGFDVPAGSSAEELGVSWRFQAAGGYNFNKKFGVLLEYDYDKFSLTGGNLNRQYLRYVSLGLKDQNGRPVSFAGLDGNAHVWSITLNPMYTFYQSDAMGAYVIGGGGFYRKLTNFTLPQAGVYCDFFGFCYTFTQNQTFDHYSNNAGGFNGGIGFTYRFSRFASEKLYGEARYVWVANSQSTDSIGGLYPENNKRTGYFPISFGIRW